MKRLLFLFCFTALLSQSSKAQIIHHNINPDTTLGGGATLAFFVVQPPPSLAQFHIFWNIGNMVYLEVHGTFGNGEVMMNAGYPAKLQSGNNITSAGTWHEAAGPSGFLSASINGNWRSDATDKYIGFRFKSSAGSGWHYGWLKMTVAEAGASFTVKEWAYQATADVPIKAGELSGTGIDIYRQGPWIELNVSNRTIYFLHLESGTKYRYLITDLSGRNIRQGNIGIDESINVNNLASGTYVVQVLSKDYSSRFKVALP